MLVNAKCPYCEKEGEMRTNTDTKADSHINAFDEKRVTRCRSCYADFVVHVKLESKVKTYKIGD